MATRSAIGIKKGNRIRAVYCHSDGYVEHNGSILSEFYADSVKASALIAQGDISSLGASVGTKHDFAARWLDEDYVKIGDRTQVAPETTFYGRDRGEKDVSFRSFATEAEFVEHYDHCGCEYYYLMDNGVWYVKEYDREFKPLHEMFETV